MIKEYFDWRGGYCSDTPSELMTDNELLIARNCQWRAGLIKRKGIGKYQTSDWSGFSVVRGGDRFFINNNGTWAWVTIVALDTGAVVNFYQGTGTTFTAIDNDFDLTTGKNVELAELGGFIVAVNGTDKPHVIYNTAGTWTINTLEGYDERVRSLADWFAGQWDDSETVKFIDDTTDAQDTGDDNDFQITSDQTNDGCYISCVVPFTKVVFTGAEQMAGSPIATYKYWNGTAWTSVGTLVTTPVWDAAAGNRTLEFNIPLDATETPTKGTLLWKAYDGTASEYTGVSGISNNFVLQIQFTTAPTAAKSCDTLTVSHTQYLTQIFENERPSAVAAHNSRMHLGFDFKVNMSPPNKVTGWRQGEVQLFAGGGNTIQRMISYQDQLLVLKEDTIFSLTGTSYDTWVTSRALSSTGTIAPRSAAMVGGYLFFVSRDGIMIWNGGEAVKVSNHIRADLDSWTLTNACGINYKNEYWVSFPTQSIVLTCDPDSLRQAKYGTDIGEGRVSFYKFTGYEVHGWIWFSGQSDSDVLLGLSNDGTNPSLAKCDSAAVDSVAGSNTNIAMWIRSKFFGGQLHSFKGYTRVRIKLGEVSASGGAAHTLTLYSDDGDASDATTLTVPTGTRYYETYVSVPYTLDGLNLAVDLQHSLATSAKLTSFAFEHAKRRF